MFRCFGVWVFRSVGIRSFGFRSLGLGFFCFGFRVFESMPIELAKVETGQSRSTFFWATKNWPNSNWPKSAIGLTRKSLDWPKSNWPKSSILVELVANASWEMRWSLRIVLGQMRKELPSWQFSQWMSPCKGKASQHCRPWWGIKLFRSVTLLTPWRSRGRGFKPRVKRRRRVVVSSVSNTEIDRNPQCWMIWNKSSLVVRPSRSSRRLVLIGGYQDPPSNVDLHTAPERGQG